MGENSDYINELLRKKKVQDEAKEAEVPVNVLLAKQIRIQEECLKELKKLNANIKFNTQIVLLGAAASATNRFNDPSIAMEAVSTIEKIMMNGEMAKWFFRVNINSDYTDDSELPEIDYGGNSR